jgi:glycosyltransferase involved in cell wall biosynthesis
MEYPLAQLGGVEVLVNALVAGLADRFRIFLVSDDSPESFSASPVAASVAWHFRWNPEISPEAQTPAMIAAMRAAGVALAHFHFGGTYCWAARIPGRCPVPHLRAAGIRCVLTNHLVQAWNEGYCGVQQPFFVKLGWFPFAWLSRMHLFAASEFEFTVSRADQARERSIFRPAAEKIRQIYHSRLDEDVVLPPVGGRKPEVVCVGTIGFRKGQAVLIEAFAKIAGNHPDWRLRIVGRVAQPEYMEQIKALSAVSKLGNRLEFAGAVSDAEIIRTISTAAIFTIPSFSEGLGLTLQEAMFYGCGCIGSRVGGIPDLIEHERTGLLVDAGAVDELADALERFMVDWQFRERCGTDARASILERGMTKQRMVAAHAAAYRAVLGIPEA